MYKELKGREENEVMLSMPLLSVLWNGHGESRRGERKEMRKHVKEEKKGKEIYGMIMKRKICEVWAERKGKKINKGKSYKGEVR